MGGEVCVYSAQQQETLLGLGFMFDRPDPNDTYGVRRTRAYIRAPANDRHTWWFIFPPFSGHGGAPRESWSAYTSAGFQCFDSPDAAAMFLILEKSNGKA